MAHHIGYLQGNRGMVSRLGSKESGIRATGQGWNLGAEVYAYYDEQAKEDRVRITLNSGSRGHGAASRRLGTFRRKGNKIVEVK